MNHISAMRCHTAIDILRNTYWSYKGMSFNWVYMNMAAIIASKQVVSYYCVI